MHNRITDAAVTSRGIPLSSNGLASGHVQPITSLTVAALSGFDGLALNTAAADRPVTVSDDGEEFYVAGLTEGAEYFVGLTGPVLLSGFAYGEATRSLGKVLDGKIQLQLGDVFVYGETDGTNTVGQLSTLTTSAKTSTVAAINEVRTAALSMSTTDVSAVINSDATAAANDNPYLEFRDGDAIAAPNDDLVKAKLTLDGVNELLELGVTRQRNGGAVAQVGAHLSIGRVGEVTASVDAVLDLRSANDASAARVATVTHLGQEHVVEVSSPTAGLDLALVGSGELGINASPADANMSVSLSGSQVNFGAGGGSAPDVVLARTGANTIGMASGDTFTSNALGETTAGAGISLATGSEILGVSRVISAAVAYNTVDATLFSVPAGEVWVLEDMWFNTTVSWDGDGSAIIGDATDADGYLVLANASLQTTYDETGGVAGWTTGTRGLKDSNRGAYMAGAAPDAKLTPLRSGPYNILLDNTTGTSTTGAGTAYLRYTRLS